MVLTAASCSPRRPGFVVSVTSAMREAFRRLDISVGISGPHDFAVRFPVTRQCREQRPPHPAPTFVTIAIRPSWRARDARRDARDLPVATSIDACGRLARRANQVGRWKTCQGRLANASRKSSPRTRGPIRRGPSIFATRGEGLRDPLTTVVMGPCVRRDDGSSPLWRTLHPGTRLRISRQAP